MFFLKQLKLAIIMRTDIKLSKGKLASQAAHAAVIAYQQTLEESPKIAAKWLQVGQPKIVLKVDSLEALEKLELAADQIFLMTSIVRDAGRTQIAAGTLTCLALGPDYDDRIDSIIKELKLL